MRNVGKEAHISGQSINLPVTARAAVFTFAK